MIQKETTMRGPSESRPARPFTTDAYPERVTDEDARLIGLALLGAAANMASMGHEGPAGLASYVNPAGLPSWHARFVLDMVAGAQGFPDPGKGPGPDLPGGGTVGVDNRAQPRTVRCIATGATQTRETP